MLSFLSKQNLTYMGVFGFEIVEKRTMINTYEEEEDRPNGLHPYEFMVKAIDDIYFGIIPCKKEDYESYIIGDTIQLSVIEDENGKYRLSNVLEEKRAMKDITSNAILPFALSIFVFIVFTLSIFKAFHQIYR